MATAAAPPHRGLPAGRAGPRGWPDSGPPRLAGRRRLPPGPQLRPRRLGGGAGGRAGAPRAASSARVALPGAASAEEARRPRSRGDTPSPAATGTAASFPRGGARFSAVPPSLSGSAARQGPLASPPPRLPLRPRRAESGGGGGSSHRLIFAFPTRNAALLSLPESPPEGPWDRPGERVERASQTLVRTGLANAAAPSATAHSAAGSPPSSGSQPSPLGPPPPPGAHYPRSREKTGTEHARRGACGARAWRGGAEMWGPGRRSLPLPGTCWEPVPD